MLHEELVQQRVPLLGLGGEAPEGLPQGGRQLVADKRKVKIGSELRRADEMETLEATFACMEAAENSGIIKGGAGCNEEDAKRRRVKARWTVDEVKDLGD